MKKYIISIISLIAIISAAAAVFAKEGSRCKESDTICGEFEALAQAGQFDKIVSKAGSSRQYSEEARHYIGKAYLSMAAAESNTPEQEEAFCRKALQFGAAQAYMGLYFIYAEKDQAIALGLLKEYIATKPPDPVPYVILGEAELGNRNYRLADTYLRESKKTARARSPRVDWMLFQANYLLGNYAFAAEMLERALNNGTFDQELKALASDVRFQGIAKRPEFRKYRQLVKADGTS